MSYLAEEQRIELRRLLARIEELEAEVRELQERHSSQGQQEAAAEALEEVGE